MGIGGALLGQDIMENVEKRVNTLKDALVPKIDELIIEQKRTNVLLGEILKELTDIRKK